MRCTYILSHLSSAVLAAKAEGAAVEVRQPQNETAPDRHHILVKSGEQFSSDRAPRLCGATSGAAPRLGPPTPSAPR